MTKKQRQSGLLKLFQQAVQNQRQKQIIRLTTPELRKIVPDNLYDQLVDEIELLDGASDELDMEKVSKGELTCIFRFCIKYFWHRNFP